MIALNPIGGKIRIHNSAEHRGRLQVALTEDQIARQMRSRRRQLHILRIMAADREVRHER